MEVDLMADLRLGIEAEAFLVSDIGRYLAQRAECERDEALADFRAVDPTDSEKVRQIQNRIWRAETFVGWLTEAINVGRYAAQELQSPE